MCGARFPFVRVTKIEHLQGGFGRFRRLPGMHADKSSATCFCRKIG